MSSTATKRKPRERRPFTKFRLGRVKVAIWAVKRKRGFVTTSRSNGCSLREDGQWQTSISFGTGRSAARGPRFVSWPTPGSSSKGRITTITTGTAAPNGKRFLIVSARYKSVELREVSWKQRTTGNSLFICRTVFSALLRGLGRRRGGSCFC